MDLGLTARFIIAFVVVLALIGLTAWLIRRFSGGAGLPYGWSRGREHRIEVLDATAVDPKRRLVLVRRDHVEHLVMIGGANDLVVESGIAPPPAVAAARTETDKESDKEPAVQAKPEPTLAKEDAIQELPAMPKRSLTPKPRDTGKPAFKSRATSTITAASQDKPAPAQKAPPKTDADEELAGLTDMAKRLETALKPLEMAKRSNTKGSGDAKNKAASKT